MQPVYYLGDEVTYKGIPHTVFSRHSFLPYPNTLEEFTLYGIIPFGERSLKNAVHNVKPNYLRPYLRDEEEVAAQNYVAASSTVLPFKPHEMEVFETVHG